MTTTSTFNKKSFFLPLLAAVLLVPVFYAQALTITPIRLEIAGDPGQTLSNEVTLINERDTAETYYVSYANFETQGETGNPSFVDAKEGLATWMQSPGTVILGPRQSKIVQIKTVIPADADAGGHFAAAFWGTTPTGAGAGGQVSIGAKVGVLVLLHVNGPVNVKGGILEFATKNKQKFFTSRPVSFYYRFQNAGGDRIKPKGEIAMRDIIGLTEAKVPGNPVDGNILPNSVRKLEAVWYGKDKEVSEAPADKGGFFDQVKSEWNNFAFGYYRAHLNLSYGSADEKATAVFGFWIVPWHLLIFIIILLLIIFFVARTLARHYNKWIITQAEEMLEEKEHHMQQPKPVQKKTGHAKKL